MADLTLDVDAAVSEVAKFQDFSNRRVQLAVKRAIRKTLRWVHREILRYVSQESGVAQKKFKQYRRVKLVTNKQDSYVWIGLNPLPLHEAGRVSWNPASSGARVAGKTYEGAFYRSVYSAQQKVWIRSSRNKKLGHATYHPKKRYHAYGSGPSRGRFPVELLGVDMEDLPDDVGRRIEKRAESRMVTLLEQELNYALNHER